MGRGSAPELRISTVLDWMPKERGAAPRVGSRAWPTCTRQKDFSGKMTKKVVYLWAIGRRSEFHFRHPWLCEGLDEKCSGVCSVTQVPQGERTAKQGHSGTHNKPVGVQGSGAR